MAVRVRETLKGAILVAVCLFSTPAILGNDERQSLFSQAAQSVLDREFPSTSISFLLIDAHSGAVIADRWQNSDTPIPVGSLIKPFTALSYAQGHRSFPFVLCNGRRDKCWLNRGHGRIGLREAISQSCNAYFISLAREISMDDANSVFRGYNLPPVGASDKVSALAGLSNQWQVAPVVLARAYAGLSKELRRAEPGIYAGMRGSASFGTARAVALAVPGHSVLAKTGTASCTHSPPGSADGFAMLLYPEDGPRVVLFVRVHNVTGAASAAIAAQMLRRLEDF